MTETDRVRRQRELAELDREFQRKQREFREDFNQRRNEELQSIIERTNRIIRQMAEQDKYDLIVQEAVYFNPRIDITEKVLRALEQRREVGAMAATAQSLADLNAAIGRASGGRLAATIQGSADICVDGLAPRRGRGCRPISRFSPIRAIGHDALTTRAAAVVLSPRARGSYRPPAAATARARHRRPAVRVVRVRGAVAAPGRAGATRRGAHRDRSIRRPGWTEGPASRRVRSSARAPRSARGRASERARWSARTPSSARVRAFIRARSCSTAAGWASAASCTAAPSSAPTGSASRRSTAAGSRSRRSAPSSSATTSRSAPTRRSIAARWATP